MTNTPSATSPSNLGTQVLLGYLLCDAIKRKDPVMAKTVLAAGPDLTVSRLFYKRQMRPLEMAIDSGQDELAITLVQQGAPLTENPAYDNEEFRRTESVPFMLASQKEQWHVVSAIIKKSDPAESDQWIRDRLFYAAIGDRGSEITALIGLGADPNMHDPVLRQTPLAHAAACGHAKAIQALVDAGADWLRGNHPALATQFGVNQTGSVVRMVPRVGGRKPGP